MRQNLPALKNNHEQAKWDLWDDCGCRLQIQDLQLSKQKGETAIMGHSWPRTFYNYHNRLLQENPLLHIAIRYNKQAVIFQPI